MNSSPIALSRLAGLFRDENGLHFNPHSCADADDMGVPGKDGEAFVLLDPGNQSACRATRLVSLDPGAPQRFERIGIIGRPRLGIQRVALLLRQGGRKLAAGILYAGMLPAEVLSAGFP